jgi:hypothetical protein
LQHQLDVAREVYNACLLERREAYRLARLTLNYYAQANQLKHRQEKWAWIEPCPVEVLVRSRL